jgi:hypothetical protein
MRWTKDVGKGLIVGDPVQVAIDGGTLIFLKPDGKELYSSLLRNGCALSLRVESSNYGHGSLANSEELICRNWY